MVIIDELPEPSLLIFNTTMSNFENWDFQDFSAAAGFFPSRNCSADSIVDNVQVFLGSVNSEICLEF